jgi:hypothetical protein
MNNIQIPIFNLEEIKKSAPDIFDNRIYDVLLHIAYSLFGKSSVSVNKEQYSIFISDKIYLHISLSTNECKAYFFSYIIPSEYAFPQPADIRYCFMKLNKPFRLFSLSTMVNYLSLKAQENEFIRQLEE